jgi:hypothetical protein
MPMEPKAPVVLVVLVESAKLRWFVAALGLDGTVIPLLRSEVGDLDPYEGLDFDNQVSFLRHRFCGVLQRGCDRLWARYLKACQFVFLFDGVLPGTTPGLNERLSEHFVQWLLNPPVACFSWESKADLRPLRTLAGQLERLSPEILQAGLVQLRAATTVPQAWELSPRKVSSWLPTPPSAGV